MTIPTKGTQIETGRGERFQCYNVTKGMYHFGKLGRKGQMLKPSNAANLMNFTPQTWATAVCHDFIKIV